MTQNKLMPELANLHKIAQSVLKVAESDAKHADSLYGMSK